VKVPATEPVKITKRPKLVGFECLLEASRRKLPFGLDARTTSVNANVNRTATVRYRNSGILNGATERGPNATNPEDLS